MFSLLAPRLRRCPKQSVYGVLTKGEEESIRDLDHVVHEVELDHGLGLDHVVQHAGVYIRHGIATASNDEKLEEINDFCRMKEPVIASPTTWLDPDELKRVSCEDR